MLDKEIIKLYDNKFRLYNELTDNVRCNEFTNQEKAEMHIQISRLKVEMQEMEDKYYDLLAY